MGQLTAIIITSSCIATVAMAKPPATETAPPTHNSKSGQQAAHRAEPAVELQLQDGKIAYNYDLRDIFDKDMWKVLEENGYSEITVETRVLDAAGKLQGTQYHQLKIELLPSGKVRVMTSPRRGRIYASRAKMLEALARVSGEPMQAPNFKGNTGHLELIVLVNPVKVYAFPDDGAPVADRKVIPRTVYDRKLELRSGRLPAE